MEEEEYDTYDPEDELAPIKLKIENIKNACWAAQRDSTILPFYSDVEFPANDSSLYKNPLEPPEYASKNTVIEWTRPPSNWQIGDKSDEE